MWHLGTCSSAELLVGLSYLRELFQPQQLQDSVTSEAGFSAMNDVTVPDVHPD